MTVNTMAEHIRKQAVLNLIDINSLEVTNNENNP